MNKYVATIIVPVYNVENFIEKCATTLFEQDCENIEYIFVNDCTPDNSIEILKSVIKKFPDRKNDIKIINKKINEGLGQARKTGIENATGEYLIHIDSDDWVEPDMISSLYSKAEEANADIVCCDYFINFKHKEIYKKSNYIEDPTAYTTKENCLKNILSMYISVSLCDKFYKRKLYNKIKFPNFSHGEDSFINLQIFLAAEKICFLDKAFLHYNKTNTKSISYNNQSIKSINDFKNFSNSVIDFLESENLSYLKKYHYIGLLELVIPASTSNFKKDINKIAPKSNSIRYVLKNKKFSLLRKIVYSLVFLNLGFLVGIVKKIYRSSLGIK